MLTNIQEILKLYRQQLEGVTDNQIKKIILFGSYARGDFKINSDIDVMILVDASKTELKKCENRIYDMTYEFNCEHDTEIMPVVQDEKHFNHWKEAYMFYHNIEKEGVTI